jgi:hypothetical protein
MADIITGQVTQATVPQREASNAFVIGGNSFVSSLASGVNEAVNAAIWIWNDNILVWMNYMINGVNLFDIGPVPVSDPESEYFPVFDMFSWLLDMLSGIADLGWAALAWLSGLITMAADVPLEVYHNLADSVSEDAYDLSDEIACVGSNFWCYFWAGVYLVNETISDTIAYPLVITLLIAVTLVVVARNIFQLLSIEIG